MKIDIEKQVETIRTIGSRETTQGEQERNEQLAEKADRDARLKVLKKYWTPFEQIYKKIQAGLTLDEIQEEIKQKKSNMTAAARDFALTQEKYIKLWIEDLKNKSKEDFVKLK